MSNLNTSFDWRAENVASRESKYTYFLGETKFTEPPGKQRLDFWLSHDKVVHRETAANVCASLPIKIIFCSHFRVGMYEKHFKKIKIKVTSTTGNSEDSSTLPCHGNKTHGIPWSRSLVTYFTNFARCLHYNCLEAKVNTISRVARGQRMRK